MRVSVDNATVNMAGVSDYLADILACLQDIEETLNALRDSIEAK